MLRQLPLSSPRDLAARADGPPRRRPVLAGAVAASALTALTLMPSARAAAGAPQAPAPAAADAAAPTPAIPHLDWQACGGGFYCATAAVPLDYAHPAGTKISIAVIKHPATDPAHRIGSLFFNPGGPGDSGVTFLRQGYSLFPPAVRARFDIVSFDPRGIGQSTVLQCFASNGQEQQLLGPVASEGYPVSAAQQWAWESTWARFDRACAAHAGPLLAHDSTADTARDMDLLRRAVGDPTLNYLGISYEYATQAALASARSGVVGPDWTWPAEACAQWPVLARDRYTGPFNRPTAAPILVVGNTIDPATPYQDAVAMSHDLADARLLTVDGYGHTALANPSNCVALAEDSYFVSGTLPPPGTVCHQNALPFAG